MAGKGKAKIGAVISLDGEKEFKSAVSGVSKELTGLQSEMSLVTAKFEGNANTLEALKAKHEVLQKVLDAQKQKQDKVREALDHAKTSYDKVGTGLGTLRKQYESASARMQEMEKDSKTTTEELEDQKKRVSELSEEIKKGERNYEIAGNRIKDWETRLNKAETEVIKANKALEKNSQYLDEAQKSTDQCAKSINEYGDKVKQAENATLSWKEAMKAAVATNGLEAMAEGFKKIGEESIGTATEITKAANQVQASTGITNASMREYKSVMEEIYKNNYGDNFDDVADAVSTIAQNIKDIDPTQMKATAENAITLRDTFGFDYQEEIRAVNMLMTTFGVTSDTAFNLIAQGAQKGLNKNDDLLDTINEYSVHYKQMGVTAEGFFNSLENGAASGTFSVDKLGDAYKEFGIRVKDTTNTTTEAYGILGMNADNMRAKFAAGGDSAKKATTEVLTALYNMSDQVKQNQAGVDLFGTMWEDLGINGIKALTNLNGSISTTKDTMKDIQNIKYDDVTNQMTQLGRTIQMKIAEPLAEKYLPTISKGLELVGDNLDETTTGLAGLGAIIATNKIAKSDIFIGVAKAIGSMQEATEGATIAQKALNLAQNLSPAGAVMIAIGALTAGIIAFQHATEKAAGDTKDFVDEISKSRSQIQNSIDERKDSTDSINLEWSANQKLTDRLMELNDVMVKTSGQKKEMKAIVDQLKDDIPELTNAYDEETSSINLTDKALKNIIEKRKEYALAVAAQNSLQSIAQDVTDTELKLNQANDKLEKLKENYKSMTGIDFGSTKGRTSQYQGSIADTFKINATADAIEQLQTEVSGLKDANAEANDQMKYAQDTISEYSDVLGDANDSTNDLADAQQNAGTKAKEMTEAQVQAYQELQGAIESSIQSSISAFDEFNGGTKISADKVLSNLQSQVDGLQNWSDNMKTLAGAAGQGMTDEFYQYLSQMGPQSANLVQSLVTALNGNTPEFAAIVQKWTQAMDLSSGISQNVAKANTELQNQMQESASAAATGGRISGETIGTSQAEGLANTKDQVSTAATGVTDSANVAMTAKQGEFYNTGVNLMAGVSAGIISQTAAVSAAASSVVVAAEKSAKSAGDIHSPSKKWKDQIGKMLGKGAVLGIKSTITEAGEAGEALSNKAYKAATKWIDQKKSSNQISINDEIYYWEQIKSKLGSGTKAYEKAQNKIAKLKEKQSYALSGGALDSYKTYYQVSAQAEVQYWDTVRQQFSAGTAERIEADQKYYDAKADMNEKLEDLNKEYYDNTKDVNDKLADDIKDLTDTYNDAVKERSDAIYNSFNLFDSFSSTSKSGDELLNNLHTQVAGYAYWQDQLQTLNNKNVLSGGLLDELSQMGPEAAASIAALNNLSSAQLEEYNRLWEQKKAISDAQAAKDEEDLKAQTAAKIEQLKSAAQAELDAYKATYEASIAELTSSIEAPLQTLANNATTWGEATIVNYIGSIQNGATSKKTTATLLTATTTISTELGKLSEKGKSIGKDTLQGILDGLLNQKKITKGAKDLIDALEKAIKKEADIHSPSKRFKKSTGENIGDGVAEGVEESTKNVTAAGTDMITQLADAQKNKVQEQQETLKGYMANMVTLSGADINQQVTSITQNKVSVDNSGTSGQLQQMLDLFTEYLPQLANQSIVLDTGTVVGSTSSAMGNALALSTKRRR